ncbi:MAG: RES family NAD+ phosphorylase [Gallionella sp.]|nr:RES family NAD+ phosphorylase [Gallionella sp.]
MRVWRIATQAPDYAADDLSGAGAKITGGRWNQRGVPVLYCSDTPSLACLETLVHLDVGGLPLYRFLVAIDIPEKVWKVRTIATVQSLESGWDAFLAENASVDFGSQWAMSNKSAVLVVPSAIVPEDSVILLNPKHSDISRITATKVRRWTYDARLVKPVAS